MANNERYAMINILHKDHARVKVISQATGIKHCKIVEEVIDLMEERYKDKIQKYLNSLPAGEPTNEDVPRH